MRPIYGHRPFRISPYFTGQGEQILYRFPNGYGVSVIPSLHDGVRDLLGIKWAREGLWRSACLPGLPFARKLPISEIEQKLTDISQLTEEQVEEFQARWTAQEEQ